MILRGCSCGSNPAEEECNVVVFNSHLIDPFFRVDIPRLFHSSEIAPLLPLLLNKLLFSLRKESIARLYTATCTANHSVTKKKTSLNLIKFQFKS